MKEADLAGLSDARLAQEVRGFIDHAACSSPADPARCMPAHLLTGANADAAAVFVATCGRHASAPGRAPVASSVPVAARRGEHLVKWRGCVGCHFSNGAAAAGPPLQGLSGSQVELADGRTVKADDAYLTALIAAPDSAIVKGYQSGFMSARVAPEHLTARQIADLAAYIKTLQ